MGSEGQDRTEQRANAGRRFAYRERAHTPGEPVRPVELVKEGPPRSQKVRVRWLDGEYEGLEEWVPKVRLVAPWDEAEALLEDERRMLAALEASGEAYDTVPWKAVETVFSTLPQEPNQEISLGHKAIERELLIIDDLDAVAPKLSLEPEELLAEPHAFVDRFGHYKAPFPIAVRIAKHCCRRFSREVLGHLRGEEEALRSALVSSRYAWPHLEGGASEIRREWAEERLREEGPVFGLIRGWCGQDSVDEFNRVLALEGEVDRLRQMVESTARWLRDTGHPVKAALLLKELDQPSDVITDRPSTEGR